ncbi:hypothetical protein HMN09_01016700 [Mycena chlorophos]|uniref:Uncharacterized protein n=1 Tax=Mycena chlorophos TaxID=658473 RepID=A0A8H6SEF6_MYCCL|nr:hypothetical protein HMN09_01016700 [Mycena chlorophos]
MSFEPVSPSRTTSMRRIARIWRPRRGPGPSYSPPSSPSLYSLSDESESRPRLGFEGEHPPPPLEEDEEPRPSLSPTTSTFSSSDGLGGGLRTPPTSLEIVTVGLAGIDRSGLNSPTNSTHTRRPQRNSADLSWANKQQQHQRSRPERIIIADSASSLSDTASLRSGRVWDVPAVMSPAEWLASTRNKEQDLPSTPVSPHSSESPDTPRFRATSDMQQERVHPIPKPVQKPGIEFEAIDVHGGGPGHGPVLAGSRTRSSSDPHRSFLGNGSGNGPAPPPPPHHHAYASTAPATPTSGFIITEKSASASLPPPLPPASTSTPSRRSSMNSPSPSPNTPRPPSDDVYFTAAGRRESRLYANANGPNMDPPTRPVHTHSNSEPKIPPATPPVDQDPTRYATWNSYRKRAATVTTGNRPAAARPFEDSVQGDADVMYLYTDNTPVSRKEQMWSGEWNRGSIHEVIQELRELR